jgi:hypothetical protein
MRVIDESQDFDASALSAFLDLLAGTVFEQLRENGHGRLDEA